MNEVDPTIPPRFLDDIKSGKENKKTINKLKLHQQLSVNNMQNDKR